jgi:hypothetical protein
MFTPGSSSRLLLAALAVVLTSCGGENASEPRSSPRQAADESAEPAVTRKERDLADSLRRMWNGRLTLLSAAGESTSDLEVTDVACTAHEASRYDCEGKHDDGGSIFEVSAKEDGCWSAVAESGPATGLRTPGLARTVRACIGREEVALRDAGQALNANRSGRSGTSGASPDEGGSDNGIRFNTGRDQGEAYAAAYCEIGASRKSRNAVYCWTPNDGYTLRLVQGRVARLREDEANNRGRAPVGFHEIPIGRRVEERGFTCVNSDSGLDCSDRTGHGWTLPRYVGLPQIR